MRGLPEELEVGEGTALRLDGSVELGVRPVGVRFGEIEGEVGWGVVGEEVLWWCVLEVPAGTSEGKRELWLRVEGSEGGEEKRLLGETVVSSRIDPAERERSATKRAIAICMATFEPKEEWLVRQLDSIRAQTRTDWVCFISDDGSSDEGFAVLERAVGDDPRFVVSRSERNVGFYANFERALRMVPGDAELVALCDQDDRWDPDKLEVLAAALDAEPGALLAYSDMRTVSEDGEVIAETFWSRHANGWDDIASMAIINTVTGAASLFRRELLDVALPFPPAGTPEHYHDHWLALCALASAEIKYLDRSTYDYTRHLTSVTLTARPEFLAPPATALARTRASLSRWSRRLRKGFNRIVWSRVYLDRYLMVRQYAAVLELRAGPVMKPARRRELGRLARAESSPAAAAWLLSRALLRPLQGRRETQGRDRVVLGSLVWRAVVVRRGRKRASS